MAAEQFDAIVVGAGLAGLAAAYRLHERGLAKVVVLEKSDRVGGCIRTLRADGRLFETGPNSLRGHCPSITSLARAVGIDDTRIHASGDASERWIWAHDKRHRAPGGPKELASTALLSRRGRLRLLGEPLRRPWRRPVNETTIAAFLGDRLGPEALEALGAPVTSGIFAGEPEDIGVEAFGPLGIAAAAGGIVRGMAGIRAVGGGSGLWTFRDGLGALVSGLAERLEIRTATEVTAWEKAHDGFVVRVAAGDSFRAPRLVFAAPGDVTGALLGADVLTGLRAASVVTASMAFGLDAFQETPTGFGMLVARTSPLAPVLGVVLASRVFAGRAPAGELVLSAICGGTRHPDAIDTDDSTLEAGVLRALDRAFALRGGPRATHLTRWRRAIPQVPPGHLDRVRALLNGLPPGLALAGNGLGGVSLEQVATSGLAAADRVSAG